jgi:hypothetical protein
MSLRRVGSKRLFKSAFGKKGGYVTLRSTIAALVLLCSIPVAAHATLATWTFYETSCTTSTGMSGDCNPASPIPLLALTLPAGGSATADVQIGLRPPDVAVFTGDPFVLDLPGGGRLFPTAPYIEGLSALQTSFSWPDETFRTTSFFPAFNIGVDINGTTGQIFTTPASGGYGGCPELVLCNVSGEWIVTPAVPEPPTASLLILPLGLLLYHAANTRRIAGVSLRHI